MTPGRKCRSPICDNVLRSDNETGFCRECQNRYPGRRWYLRTRPDFAEWVEGRRIYERALRAGKRAQGLCVECSRPGRPGLAKCRRCQDNDTRQQRERRQQRRAA